MTEAATPRPVEKSRSDRTVQLRAAGLLVGALLVVGAVLGVIWQAWSPPGPAGAVLAKGVQADETEAFVAGDGRFALLVALAGLAAAVAAWHVPALKRARGPYLALGLAVGGVGAAALTEWVGYLLRGSGDRFACNSSTGACIDHLPLTVHMHALLLLEAIVATLAYSLFVAFAVDDDLGRPDRQRPAVTAPEWHTDDPPAAIGSGAPHPPSVGAQRDLQQPWRDRDTPGAP